MPETVFQMNALSGRDALCFRLGLLAHLRSSLRGQAGGLVISPEMTSALLPVLEEWIDSAHLRLGGSPVKPEPQTPDLSPEK